MSALANAFPQTALLDWYGSQARALPWRLPPSDVARGARPDPYRVWLSEIMLQQTTVAAVAPRFARFLSRWPMVAALADAPLDDVLGEWAGLGYYARARNLHRAAVAVARDRGGVFPDTEEGLRALPGVGAYTAAAVAAIAFGRRAVVVDGNVERVMARWFAVETPFPAGKAEARARAAAVWPQTRSGDFAQALMDLGAGVCTPRSPACDACPLRSGCAARRRGDVESFPRRAKKTAKPARRGAAFALLDGEGRVAVERRAENGLLGGMIGLPGTPWGQDGEQAAPPVDADWRRVGAVLHTFTHFTLTLDVHAATRPVARLPDGLQWADAAALRLPTVMRKALDLALQAARRTTTEPAE